MNDNTLTNDCLHTETVRLDQETMVEYCCHCHKRTDPFESDIITALRENFFAKGIEIL
jgi:hypothetical protein